MGITRAAGSDRTVAPGGMVMEGLAAEGEGVGGGEVDICVDAGRGEGEVGGADGEGLGAEFVGELDADERATEGDVDDLAEGHVGAAEAEVGEGFGVRSSE